MANSLNSNNATSKASSVGRPSSYYPSPFFDVGDTYMPSTIAETFRWCEYYQLTHSVVSTVTSRLAAYPVTDLIIEDENEGVAMKWRDFYSRIIKYRTTLVESNLNRYTYGIVLHTLALPFVKMLHCRSCRNVMKAKDAGDKKVMRWRGVQFYLQCPKCGHDGPATVVDDHIKSPEKIRLVRWSPHVIDIDVNEITGKTRYYYKMPSRLKNQIMLGKPDIIYSVPQVFLDAVKNDKAVLIDPDKIFHAVRPGITRSTKDSGYGQPLILPVLKDLYLLQILKKSQEAVALEHIVPMRVLYPQVTTDGNNIYAMGSLPGWQKEVATQVNMWKKDHNYMPVMPFPVGYQLIGGQGRSMLLHQEMRVYTDQIVAGMGVPTSFYYGEAAYSGASVNLKSMENEFMGNRIDMQRLIIFIRDQVAAFLGWPKSSMRQKPFKMADDIQRATHEMNMAGAGYISKRTVVENRDFDYSKEQRFIKEETAAASAASVASAVFQGKAQAVMMIEQTKGQIQAQELQQAAAPPPPPEQGQPGAEGQQPQEQGQPGAEGQQPAQGGQPPQEQQQQQQQQQQQGPPQPVQGMEQSVLTANNGGQMVDMMATAKKAVESLHAMKDGDAYARLQSLKQVNPNIYALVVQGYGKALPGRSGRV